MKTLEDLKLNYRTYKIVKDWLNEWLQMLIKNADGREGTVYRADFENKDFFFFTECNDLVSQEIEHVGRETSASIRARKRYVMFQLLLKNMMGNLETIKNKCSHCGHPERYTAPLDDAGTYFHFCPKCHFTSIHTYPTCFPTCIEGISKVIADKLKIVITPIFKKK